MASSVYVVVSGRGEERRLAVDPVPFTIGRRSTHPLVIADPHISRDHAQIGADEDGYYLLDLAGGSTVNGQRAARHRLTPGDRIEFPACPGLGIVFDPAPDASVLLTQMRAVDRTEGTGELEMLRLFLDFARRLRSARIVGEVLSAMLDCALRLTGAERGLVFLPGADGRLEVAAARSTPGAPPADETTISRSVVREAMESAAEFVLAGAPLEAGATADMELGQSIVTQGLRTVVCLPLHDPRVRAALSAAQSIGPTTSSSHLPRAIGVLYLDSHAARPQLSMVSQDLLRALASEAANLVTNVRLVEAEERARRLERELELAAAIQQGLMAGEIPRAPYLQVSGHSVACRHIGGDFFDVLDHAMAGQEGITVILADVSGKGPAAALLASSLQGIAHAQLLAGAPLTTIAQTMNAFLRARPVDDKYATVLLLRITPDGALEYLNCGHQPPVLASADGQCRTLLETCVPVGLLPAAEFACQRLQLAPGDRILASSDGVPDATNAAGEFFGEERLLRLAAEGAGPEAVVAAARAFCAGVPFNDDCTLVEARFTGAAGA
jgi:sigma-B regulation protein RsbU (phosphoserine phosphatase)